MSVYISESFVMNILIFLDKENLIHSKLINLKIMTPQTSVIFIPSKFNDLLMAILTDKHLSKILQKLF